MVYYSIAWATDKNLGKAYNKIMQNLPNDDDFACFIDGDAMFLNQFFGKQIEDVIEKYPDCGIFTCMTNRVKSSWQITGDWESDDIKEHREIAKELAGKHYTETELVHTAEKGQLMSGVLILIKKSVWVKIGGFKEGILGVDNELHASASAHKEPIRLMKGVYVYHWYRGGNKNDRSHLQDGLRIAPNGIVGRLIERQRTRRATPVTTPKDILQKGVNVHPIYKNKNVVSSQKKIIYSAIIGDYDLPIQHTIPEGWEYILFTDNRNIKGDCVRYVDIPPDTSPVKYARFIKIMPWKFFDFDYCLWIDGNTKYNADKIEELTKHSFVISTHPERDCIYDEGEAILQFRKDTPENIAKVLKRYRNEGYPVHNGMVASHAILRKDTRDNFIFCSKWWDEVERYSHRDQMSFNYVLWKKQIPIHYMEFKSIFIPTTRHR